MLFKRLLSLYLLLISLLLISLFIDLLSLWLMFKYSYWFFILLVFSLFVTLILANIVFAIIYPVRSLFRFYPLLEMISKTVAVNTDKLRKEAIDYNNHHMLKDLIHLKVKDPKDILILLPHCIQNSTCLYKVTWEKLDNCRACYKCQIPTFLDIKKDYGVRVVVVNGGTAARSIIKDLKPKFIIAVACENDLISGLRDVSGIPVLGVLNGRPCGSCRDTTVDVNIVRRYLNNVLDK